MHHNIAPLYIIFQTFSSVSLNSVHQTIDFKHVCGTISGSEIQGEFTTEKRGKAVYATRQECSLTMASLFFFFFLATLALSVLFAQKLIPKVNLEAAVQTAIRSSWLCQKKLILSHL